MIERRVVPHHSTSITSAITCMTDSEEPFVLTAVQSVLNQTISSTIKLYVRDNCEWIDDLLVSAGMRQNVSIVRLPIAPAAYIRNSAVEQCETEFIAFLDADDVWRRNKLEVQLESILEKGLDVVGSRHILIRDDGARYFFGFVREFPLPSSWLGRAAVFRELPFPLVPGAEDLKFWRVASKRYKVYIHRNFLLEYRVRTGSVNSAAAVQRRKAALAQASNHFLARIGFLASSWIVSNAVRTFDSARRFR